MLAPFPAPAVNAESCKHIAAKGYKKMHFLLGDEWGCPISLNPI